MSILTLSTLVLFASHGALFIWRTVIVFLTNFRCHPRRLAAPLLLSLFEEDSDSREFICLSDEKVYGGFFLPQVINKWICGSFHLLNPFTRAQIRLPPLSSFIRHDKESIEPIDFPYIVKAIISADPTTHSSDCVVLAITGNFQALSYCRVGDTKCTNIEESPVILEDIVYLVREDFMPLISVRVVVAFDSSSPDAVGTIIVGNARETIKNGEVGMLKYLVMSCGVLLKVVKFDDEEISKTYKFNVYKLQKSESPIYEVTYTTRSHDFQI